MVERDDEIKALEKFKWKVVRDHEIKVLGEVNMELESNSKKLREKLSQEEDTKEEAFEEFSSTLDNVLDKLSQENKSPDDFYGTEVDLQDDPLHETEDLFVGLDQPIQLVVAQNNVHEGVTEEVIEMTNDQAEALSSDKEVTDECLYDEWAGESRPSKRIRVTQEEMVMDQKSKKAQYPLLLFVFGS
ncbi:hypothetical protein Tco_1053886 [Tanacetum coccineum]|uniref:Uncharacterized protein n=1 Tax=Tanacetum coccineum TaxID=301880 RepID=A0ABQ5GW87_9ASTR